MNGLVCQKGEFHDALIDHSGCSILVLAFYGVSCMGKSELVAYLRERSRVDKISLTDISKDAVAKPLMDAYHRENPDLPYKDIYMTIHDQIVAAFEEEVRTSMAKIETGRHIFILDDAWASTKLIDQIMKPTETNENVKKHLLYVYPKVSPDQRHQNIPFSLQLISNLCFRVISRKSHETMVYDDIKKVQIVLSFILLYAGTLDIPAKFQSVSPKGEFVPIEFHQEVLRHESKFSPAWEKIQKIYDQTALCLESLGTPFETPFVNGLSEITVLVEMLHSLTDSESSSDLMNSSKREVSSEMAQFINYGRKSEWDKFYSRFSRYL